MQTFSTILKTHILNSTTPENTQYQICAAVNEYFTGAMIDAMAVGKFMVNGAITTMAAGATVPVMGVIATVNSYNFFPILPSRLKELFNTYDFYIGLCKAIDEMLAKSMIYVDIKNIGAIVPFSAKLLINSEIFGNMLKKFVYEKKCDTLTEWYNTMDMYFENIWMNIIEMPIFYSSPVPGGVFNGTIIISGRFFIT